MGPIGFPETVFIVVLALLLFGPKKLPELGRMAARALAEFRKASNELKSTFDREMRNLERETQGIQESTTSHYQDSYNYDYSSYDSGTPYTPPESQPALEAAAHNADAVPSQNQSASASEGAHLSVAETRPGLTVTPAPGTIANGSLSHPEPALFGSGADHVLGTKGAVQQGAVEHHDAA